MIQQYESIRNREYELITNLLEVLPRIDNIEEDRVNEVRDAMFHADHPFLMVLVGPFSSGKSSIINALLGDSDLLRVGVTPTTDRISILRYGEEPEHMGTAGGADTVFHPSPLLKRVSLVDTPGLESIFTEHEETTSRFLHRADVVLIVMQAMQALRGSNLKYMKRFKQYGKKVIVVISQSDLITDEERDIVAEYCTQTISESIGVQAPIWFVSAKLGLQANESDPRDEELWRKSGLHQFEDYIQKQLSDSERLRQKLQTPLQIVQSVHQVALSAVRSNQTTFDRYRNITDNVEQQLSAQKREQERIVRDINSEVEARFRETGDRSQAAIEDIFQFSRALGSLGRGFTELFGIARLFRRRDNPSYLETVFRQNNVFEPIDEIPQIVDTLAPRLEGQDMQDIDDLVKYGNREIGHLPSSMQEKVIGAIQAPARYDRSYLQEVRPKLEEIERSARVVETEKLELARRNTMLYLAIYELIVIILGVALINGWDTMNSLVDFPVALLSFVVVLVAVVLGFVAIPLRGRMIHTEYVNHLIKLQTRYTELLTKAADKQIEYAMQLRRETIAPLTRLVDSQANIQDEQLVRLQNAEQSITKIENELNSLGKRRFLGITL